MRNFLSLQKSILIMAKGKWKPKTYVKFLDDYEANIAKRARKRGLTITVSGLSGSGKSTIAKAIANAFKLKYITAGEIFRRFAKSRGVPIDMFAKIREKEIDYDMDRRTLKYAIAGKVLIDARLSGWVAGVWADARVFVKCSLRTRAERIAKRDGLTYKQALEITMKRDEEDTKKYQKLYGIDQSSTSIYDIVIDNSKLTYEEAEKIPVKMVKDFLKRHKQR